MSASGSGAGRSNDVAEFLNLDNGDQNQQMHAVVPLADCPHLQSVAPVPAVAVDVHAACSQCANVGENWICLVCYQVNCSRFVQEHSLTHTTVSGHPLALSLADLSVWCYPCEAYVHNPALLPAKNAAHLSKFGVEMPS